MSTLAHSCIPRHTQAHSDPTLFHGFTLQELCDTPKKQWGGPLGPIHPSISGSGRGTQGMFTEQNRNKNTLLGCWEKIYVRSSVRGSDAHDHKHSLSTSGQAGTKYFTGTDAWSPHSYHGRQGLFLAAHWRDDAVRQSWDGNLGSLAPASLV